MNVHAALGMAIYTGKLSLEELAQTKWSVKPAVAEGNEST